MAPTDRRKFLTGAGSVVLTGLVAGCGGNGGNGGNGDAAANDTDTETDTPANETETAANDTDPETDTPANETETGTPAQQEYDFRLGGEVAGWNGRAPSSIEGQTNPTLQLEAGQEYTVWWENVDGLPHNIAILDGDGNTMESTETITDEGATQTLTFTATEEMAEYYCAVHPQSMRGEVQVGGSGQ